MDENLHLVIRDGSLAYYHASADEDYNANYLNAIGFSWETAIEIAAWATFADDGAEYEQDEIPRIKIYIV